MRLVFLAILALGCDVRTPLPADERECLEDADCVLLPYVTCCGECPPEPPYQAGTRAELDAIFMELEERCGLDRRPCAPLECAAPPPACAARAACSDGECVAIRGRCERPSS